MKSTKTFCLGCTVLFLFCAVVVAGDHDKDKHSRDGEDEKSSEHKEREHRQDFNITVTERQIIHEHFFGQDEHGKKSKKLPPGLAKKVARGGKLPPGWDKKLVRGETVPPEVFKECQPLPKELVVKLPAPPAGTILVTINGKAARLLEATPEILGVFYSLP